METYPLKSVKIFHLAGLMWIVILFLILPLTTVCSGAPATNSVSIGWSDYFINYTNLTPLIDGTNGWYASSSSCIVQQDVRYSGSQAAMLPIGETLSNSFWGEPARNVKLEMYALPQLMTSSVYPSISTNVTAQFFINSNGFFVVGSGMNWNEASNSPAQTITNVNNSTNFVRIQINLQYNTHKWSLKAWTNGFLVASTNNLSFASNLNYFSSFSIYGGTATSYVDDVSVTRYEGPIKVNGLSFDTIRRVNDAVPVGKINGVDAQ